MNRNELKFWCCFLLLNFLLFVPRYLFEFDSSTFFPYRVFSQGSAFYTFKYIFNRENYDIFRFSIDFSFLVLLAFLFKKKIRLNIAGILLSLFYIVIFLYQAYSQSFEAIFNVEPFLYNDISSLKTGFEIVTDGQGFLVVIYVLLMLLLVFVVYSFFRYFLILIKTADFGRYSAVIMSLLIILMIYSSIRYGKEQISEMEFINVSYELADNITRSIHTEKQIRKVDLSELKQDYKYKKLNLKTSPNIYFIFIESYGKIVYTNSDLKESYLKNIARLDSLLTKNHFYSSSILSVSPVFGGTSWVSYGSVLYGINFLDSKTFDVLTNKKEIDDAVSLVKLFRSSGYKNYRLSSIKPQNDMEIPWDKYTKIYTVDQWIRFEDLNYNGKLYGFGPSPPDEYALNFAYNFIQKNDAEKEPYTLFFISMNSHTPFFAPKISENGWENLNKDPEEFVQKSVFLKKPKLSDYGNAINYQLTYLIRFISEHGGNDLFVLIGDHQPPVIAKSKDGFETPVHIISRDSTFIDGFEKYGFNRGLQIDDLNKSVRHEGLYSIFLREFMRNYADSSAILPNYLPEGISIIKK